jgi:pyruvate dehydrogenase E2 component (dihydrolipoamide acetyltransferase)
MESGTIVRWLKAEGDTVDRDEPLYELDTEKVTQEVEAGVSGILLKILASEGETLDVGKPICVIGEAGEDISALSVNGAEGAKAEAEPEAADRGLERSAEAPAPAPEQEPQREEGRRAAAAEAAAEPSKPAVEPAPAGGDASRLKASPLARKIARERGIELRRVQGTGPDGRIVAEDVERAAAAPAWEQKPVPVTAGSETVKLSSIRRTIARRLTEAWQAPHFMLTVSADMRRVIEVREALLAQAPEGAARPTISDVLTKLTAVALLRHPSVNAHFEGAEVRRFATANVGLAVAIPDGLVVPVIRHCDSLSIQEIAAARVEVVERTRAGKLQPEDLEGGTFTISNLGMYGIERFTAVLNPPQVAILAVGAIEERPVAEDGQVVVRPRMDMTLSCDHRAVDGATGSEFLRTLKTLLEEPALAL